MRTLTVTVVLAVVLVSALAFAAEPAKNSHFRWCENNRCPLTFNTSANGNYIKKLAMYNRCAQLPANFPRVRVRDDTGRFRKSGTVKDVLGNELTYTFKGRFRRPKRAVGTYEVDSKTIKNGRVTRRCDADPQGFVARRVGPAQ